MRRRRRRRSRSAPSASAAEPPTTPARRGARRARRTPRAQLPAGSAASDRGRVAVPLASAGTLEEVRGRARVLGRLAARSLRERGREPLVLGLDRHLDDARGAPRRTRSVSRACAPRSPRSVSGSPTTTRSACSSSATSSREPREPGVGRRALDDAERAARACRSRPRRRRRCARSRSRARAPSQSARGSAARPRRARRGASLGLLAARARHRRPAAAAAADQRGRLRSRSAALIRAPRASGRSSRPGATLPSSRAPSTTAAGACRCLKRSESSSRSSRVAALDLDDDDVDAAASLRRSLRDFRPGASACGFRLTPCAPSSSSARSSSASSRARAEQRPRLARGHRLDPPRARADRALGEDRERPDLRGRADVRAAAQLARVVLDLDDAHVVAVLLAEERHRAELARLVDASSRTCAPAGSRRPSR